MKKKEIFQKGRFLCIIQLVFVIIFSNTSLAAILKVPEGYSTIQAGIDAASEGDTVLVADGIYTGTDNKNLDFKGKKITVRSENGAENCIIDCEGDGRGFYFHSGELKDSVLSGFTIRNGNTFEGGGIYIKQSSPTITNSIVYNNIAYSGGGIYCENSFAIITNCTVNQNTASWEGGGIHCSKSSPLIANCAIINNNAAHDGGGIKYSSCNFPSIINCNISGNISNDDGGGMFISSSSPTITYCTISNNSAESDGGGIFLEHSDSTSIINCIISDNLATGDYGGGIWDNGSSPTITNCTLNGNMTTRYGGGIFSTSYSQPTITNCLFWDDMPDEIYINTGTPTVSYSNIEGGFSGAGNIDADPQFVGNGDYHLTVSSPCIDEGTSVGAPDYDIDGDQRPQDAGYDMGADEYSEVAATLTADFAVSPIKGPPPLTIDLTEQSLGYITSWYWNFGDGTISTVQNAPSHTYTELGSYTVSLTATGPAGTKTKSAYIRVGYPSEAKAMPWVPLLLLDD